MFYVTMQHIHWIFENAKMPSSLRLKYETKRFRRTWLRIRSPRFIRERAKRRGFCSLYSSNSPRYRPTPRASASRWKGFRPQRVHRNLASNVQTNRQWEAAVASGATRFNYSLACTAVAACEPCPTGASNRKIKPLVVEESREDARGAFVAPKPSSFPCLQFSPILAHCCSLLGRRMDANGVRWIG